VQPGRDPGRVHCPHGRLAAAAGGDGDPVLQPAEVRQPPGMGEPGPPQDADRRRPGRIRVRAVCRPGVGRRRRPRRARLAGHRGRGPRPGRGGPRTGVRAGLGDGRRDHPRRRTRRPGGTGPCRRGRRPRSGRCAEHGRSVPAGRRVRPGAAVADGRLLLGDRGLRAGPAGGGAGGRGRAAAGPGGDGHPGPEATLAGGLPHAIGGRRAGVRVERADAARQGRRGGRPLGAGRGDEPEPRRLAGQWRAGPRRRGRTLRPGAGGDVP
jgi:hypothetical protein